MWLAVTLLPGFAATQDKVADLNELRRESLELSGFLREVKSVYVAVEQEVVQLERQLAKEESALGDVLVDTEALRAARLELDQGRTRIAVVRGRIEQYLLETKRLQATVDGLARDLAERGVQDTEGLRRAVAVGLLREQAQQSERLAQAFRDLLRIGTRKVELLEQRLRLLQSRLELGAIGGAAALRDDDRIAMLESVISDFLRRGAQARARMAEIAGTDPEDRERLDQLARQADDAVTRGFLRQNDLELVLAANQLDALGALRGDDLLPLSVLKAAAEGLDQLAEDVARVADSLGQQHVVLDSQQTQLRRRDPAGAGGHGALGDLLRLVAFQQQDLDALEERIETEREGFLRVLAERGAAALLERRPLPTTAADWGRVAAAAGALPSLLTDGFRELRGLSAERVGNASPGQWALAALGSVLLGWGLIRLRLTPLKRSDRAMTPILAAWVRVLPGLIPAGAWTLVGLAIQIPWGLLLPVLLLLLLLPAQTFALAAVRNELNRRGARDPGEVARQERFVGLLRLGTLVAALVAALYIVFRLLSVTPALGDLVERVAMLGLLALSVPAFAARSLLAPAADPETPRARRRTVLWVLLSRALPLFLLIAGLIGLAGYANLAWSMLEYFGWLIAVTLGLVVALELLQAAQSRADAMLRERGSRLEGLWRTHFLEPGYRALQLTTVVAAGWALFRLWGWHGQTPIVRWLRGLLGIELFRIGEAAFTPGDILVALLLVAAALWIGGWSQQVSYHLAYRNVRDAGLRRALAVFTQYVVILAGVILALTIIGFDLTTLTVFAASLGVGIGFGLQSIVNNFLSGLVLLGERPLRIGDFVSIGENQGQVTQIGIRSLTVRTPDGQEVIIPNASVISEKFTNWTRSDTRVRQSHMIGLGETDDVELAMRIVRELLDEDPQVLEDPPPEVLLWEFGEIAPVMIRFDYFVDIDEGMIGALRTRSRVLLELKRRFATHGITMPFRRTDLSLALDPPSLQAVRDLRPIERPGA